MEPTGPAWLPVAVFFGRPRAPGVAGDLGQGRRPAPVPVPARQEQQDRRRDLGPAAAGRPRRAAPLRAARCEQAAALDRRVRATDRLTRPAAQHKTRIKDLARQLIP